MAEKGFPLRPSSIVNHTGSGMLEIAWSDGTRSSLAHRMLRRRCQCAECLACRFSEHAAASRGIRIVDIRAVGAYGAQLAFSDGHDRGIYPWPYLHALETSAD
ncbi:MAG TPA: DUF971 domain-containing protein [Oxalicibacterium sp.]|nr:DUF971 domain-containing protein [Oxalicibacterium sp.]